VGRGRRVSLARAGAGTARLRVVARRWTALESDPGGRRGDAWLWPARGARSLAAEWGEGAAPALRRVARRAGSPDVGPGPSALRRARRTRTSGKNPFPSFMGGVADDPEGGS